MGMAPGLANADYTDINALLGLGASQDAYGQNQLNADIARWDFNQNAPNAQLDFFSKLLQGGLQSGMTSTTTGSQTVPTNPLMAALGAKRGECGRAERGGAPLHPVRASRPGR